MLDLTDRRLGGIFRTALMNRLKPVKSIARDEEDLNRIEPFTKRMQLKQFGEFDQTFESHR